MVNLRWFSITCTWIDFIVQVPDKYEDYATTAILEAMDSYWEDECDECYGDMVEHLLHERGIPYNINYHDDDDISDKYEAIWENHAARIGCKVISK